MPYPNVFIEKKAAIGGYGGSIFDSGCNLSSVRKVHVAYFTLFRRCVIQRIFLEFEAPFHDNEYRCPFYHDNGPSETDEDGSVDNENLSFSGPSSSTTTTERTFEISPDDFIVRIEVWTDTICINAIRLSLRSGIISELYGVLNSSNAECYRYVCYQGDRPGAKLVGVHGHYGPSMIYKLGFTFASVVPTVMDFPSLMNREDSFDTKENTQSHWGYAVVLFVAFTGMRLFIFKQKH